MSHVTRGRVRPPGRYGDAPAPVRRAVALAALGLLGVALLVLLAWAAWFHSVPDVRQGLLGFRVLDDSTVRVRFEVVADPGATVSCDLRSQDRTRATVGSRTVVVGPAPQERREVEADVATRALAVTGELLGCRLA